ncbi:MAG: flagellin, partial [Fervidobacterium sp.]
TGAEKLRNFQFSGTAYFDTNQSKVVANRNNVTTNNSNLTFTTLNIGGGAAIAVGFQSVGQNQVRYVVRSYSGMTITSGTIGVGDLNAIGLKTVNLGDDLTLNIQFEQFQSEYVRLNQADIYLTSKNYQSNEGSYVVEVGQFIGGVSSQLDFRVVKSDGAGVSISNQGALRKGFSVTDGTIYSWRPDEHTISEFGGALPNEEIIDSAVARIEGKYTQDTQLVFQIGSNEGHNMFVGIDDMSAGALGITTSSLKVTDQNSAERAIMVVDAAIHKVSSARAALGAVQNRLEHTIANLGVAAENLTAAESRIRDADMAKEMMAFTRQQILLQSSMSMLAQANTQPQNVLQLLR